MNILVIIPARGGSKGIPRKNVRLMNGEPLISYVINTVKNSKYKPDIVMTSDDEEIIRLAKSYEVEVIERPSSLAGDDITLDPVVFHAVTSKEEKKSTTYDCVITMQPTSPLLKTETLDEAIKYFLDNNFDTVISGINDPHLSWTEKNGVVVPNYDKRLNRQYLPKNLVETGAFVITKREFVKEYSRFGSLVSVYEVPKDESIDIDTPQEWWIAEKELEKKNILIRVEGYSDIGLGHVYRGLLLAYNLIEHNVRFVLSDVSDLGIEKIKQSHFSYTIMNNELEIIEIIKDCGCDILINDALDTNKEYMEMCKETGVRIINLEDLGDGAVHADAVINDLYEKKHNLPKHYWGSDYYCIRDEFLLAKPSKFNKTVKEILIIFGGTDPLDLTQRMFEIIKDINKEDVHITFILGMGYKRSSELTDMVNKHKLNISVVTDVKRISDYMNKADLAISSQGRTMLELAAMEVPTVLLAQNEREKHHEFGYLKNGFINLGLGSDVQNDTIKQTLLWLINSPQIREQMKQQMTKKDLKKGIHRVKEIILGSKK
jgi:CMP-N-acetylneuraminic acid synthetase/spore coat polysaccharide biosynthesis predicted glycosyltransferase SpsG